jgi:hypothetical protein
LQPALISCAMPALLQFNHELPVLAAKLGQLAVRFHQKSRPKLMTTILLKCLNIRSRESRSSEHKDASRQLWASLNIASISFSTDVGQNDQWRCLCMYLNNGYSMVKDLQRDSASTTVSFSALSSTESFLTLSSPTRLPQFRR